MKKQIDIVNLIGISLIVVAIVSAGGLYYTATSYANISETFASVEVSISEVTAFRDNGTGQVTITALFLVDNPSDLDIEIYRIEYMANADKNSGSILEYDKYVGSGTVGNTNNTIAANSVRDIQLSTTINPDTPYMERFDYAEQDGSVYMFLNGIVWFQITDFPEANQRMDGIYFMGSVIVHEG
ncbi:MAG: hypothetical protein KAJ33_04225 [Thermoplasmata archaeon]|nr:hypothetical protein [Thermoplasmata archaeon]MCK5397435.1 hypothetical protein [Thermoplasmata archaeon]